MVRKVECECAQRVETKINSYSLYKDLCDYFEAGTKQGIFKDVSVLRPIQLFDDQGILVTEWYPDKWYKCNICGQLWAFQYPDFPAQGYVYKLDAKGNWPGGRNVNREEQIR